MTASTSCSDGGRVIVKGGRFQPSPPSPMAHALADQANAVLVLGDDIPARPPGGMTEPNLDTDTDVADILAHAADLALTRWRTQGVEFATPPFALTVDPPEAPPSAVQ